MIKNVKECKVIGHLKTVETGDLCVSNVRWRSPQPVQASHLAVIADTSATNAGAK